MSENLQLVHSILAEWERGNVRSVDWAHPRIEYAIADEPGSQVARGVAAMTRTWREFLTVWDDYRVEAHDYRELDDERVLVALRAQGRGKTSGLDISAAGGGRGSANASRCAVAKSQSSSRTSTAAAPSLTSGSRRRARPTQQTAYDEPGTECFHRIGVREQQMILPTQHPRDFALADGRSRSHSTFARGRPRDIRGGGVLALATLAIPAVLHAHREDEQKNARPDDAS